MGPRPKKSIPPQLDRLIPPDARPLIDNFIEKLGATVTDIDTRGAPDPRMPADAVSWPEWERRRQDRIFAEGQQHTPALNEAEAERHRFWLRAQREAGRTWAAWQRYWRKNPGMANPWRIDHQDESGDWRWMLQAAEPRDEKGRDAVAWALRNVRPTEANDPPQVCAACCSRRFWRKVAGDYACAICHPPPAADSAVEWVGREEISDGISPRTGKPLNPETGIAFIRDWGAACARGDGSRYVGDLDVLLPQGRMSQIEVESHAPFKGRWLGGIRTSPAA